jgi:5-methylcytosine-specific restriction endonuclease McrA
MFNCKGCGVNKTVADFRVHKRGYRIGKCRECERTYQREWSQRDPAKYRERKRESMARRRAADPQAVREYQRQDYRNNRDARLAVMAAYQRRRFFWIRATKLSGVTAHDLARLWRAQSGLCALTGRRLDRSAQLDHKLPKARGGLDAGNLQWVCQEVNLAKRDLTDVEFVALCDDVMSWIGKRIAMVQANRLEVAA